MSSLLADVRFTFRLVRRDLAFAVICVGFLSLGIGAVTAVFSIVHSVLKPLPFREPDQLVILRTINVPDNLGPDSASLPDYLDWREQADCFTGLASYHLSRLDMKHAGGYTRLRGFLVSDEFFDVLDVDPQLGSHFERARQAGTQQELLISDALWEERFDRDTQVLGAGLDMNSWATFPDPGSRVYTVRGVLPEDFRCLPASVWFDPHGVSPADRLDFCMPDDPGANLDRNIRYLRVIGRLRPGVTVAEAQAEMDVIAVRLSRLYPDTNRNWGVRVIPLRTFVFGETQQSLLIMFAAALVVLLIACGNVCHLYLERAGQRQAEMAVRAALGAPPGRLVRQLLTETALLVATAGSTGVLVAFVAIRGLTRFAPPDMPWLADVPLDTTVVLFALGVTLVSVVCVSLVPLLRVATPNLTSVLNSSGRTASRGGGRARASQFLMITELAVTFVLVVGAGLLVAKFQELAQADPGFDSANRLSLHLELPQATHEWIYNSTFCNRVLERTAGLPGVVTAAVVQGLPIDGTRFDCRLTIEGQPWIGRAGPPAFIRVISDNYFTAVGVPLLRGRAFNPTDSIGEIGGNRTAVINQTMAERFWPDEDPLGQRFKVHPEAQWLEVIGVVADMRNAGLDQAATADIYYPEKLFPQPHISLVVHTRVEPMSLAKSIRSAIHDIEADAHVTRIKPLEAVLAESLAQRRYFMVLLGALAGVALVLAIGGVMLTTFYAVSRRSREFGIRVAFGAEPMHIVRLVMAHSSFQIGAGLLAGAVLATSLLPPLIGDWEAGQEFHRVAFLVTPMVLGVVAMAACLLAAFRAARLDVTKALRAE